MRTPIRRGPRAAGALALAFVFACGVLGSATSGAAATNRVYGFASVSCVSATDCFVVGSSTTYDGGAQPSTPLVARRKGAKWSIMRSANRSGRNMNTLSDISCTASTFCMAVGTSGSTKNSTTEPMTERWDGKTWKLVSSPVTLRQVSCTKPTFCMAVGGLSVARWDGAKWTSVPMVRVAAGQQFRVVSCRKPSTCVAVGDYGDQSGDSKQVAETWNGTRWSAMPRLSSPPTGYFGLSGLACASATACMGVGSFSNGLYSNSPFATRWNGHTWSVSNATSPASIVAQLSGVACPSASSCFASGGYNSGPGPAGYPHPFVDRWNGTQWTVGSAPNIYGGLSDISCPSNASCLAVGVSQRLEGGPDSPYLGITSTLALRWNGHAWTRIATPNPT